MVFAVDPRRLWLSCLYLVREGDHVRCWFMCKAIKKKTHKKNPPLLKCYSCNGFLTMRHLAHSRLVISVLHSFLLMIVVFFVLWRWQVESTVRVLFKHVSYTELKSVIWNKLWCSLLCSKGQSFFQKKRRKKKTWKPNVVFSEFLIMYSFGDLKFVSLYF